MYITDFGRFNWRVRAQDVMVWTVAAIGSDLRVVYEGILGFVVGRHWRQHEDASHHGGTSSRLSVWSQWLAFLGARMLQDLVGLWIVAGVQYLDCRGRYG